MRLIDADELKTEFPTRDNSKWIQIALVRATINHMPTVEERKTGYWIDTGSGQECSVCGEIQYGYDNGRKFCPNCGAKMKGEVR